jgi:hypothetical protein
MYSANHDILNSKHGQSVMSMDSHIPPANMFDLNGNIQETHNTVPHYSDYREPEYGEQCFQQSHIGHNDHSNYNTGYYPAGKFKHVLNSLFLKFKLKQKSFKVNFNHSDMPLFEIC